jgi:FMN phosphatase YigB (HAD superfamily)
MNITPKQAVIVGNRLDREIIAGKRLGIPTIWIRAGEGSEAKLDDIDEKPNVVIDDIEQLPMAILALISPK